VSRILLLAATTGYQTRAFGSAAERLGVDLVFATDRCHVLEDPWRDAAIPIRFSDERGAVAAIVTAAARTPIDGVVAVGDRPTIIAAHAAQVLGIAAHPVEAAAAARNKYETRVRLREAGLLTPAFEQHLLSIDPRSISGTIPFPAVVKPLALSGSRGVIRVNDEAELVAALYRLRALMTAPDIRAERDPAHERVLIEQFIDGPEFAIEGVLNCGELHVLAVFDKPDPLDGPFFEETIYVTPSRVRRETQAAIADVVSRAAAALRLYHGPIHAECRVNPGGVFVLEVAPRPIGGLCARALKFVLQAAPAQGPAITLEELLLRHALGETSRLWRREDAASGVMMIPIPRRGVFRGVSGVDAARAVEGVEDVRVTAKADQTLLPLPEGASYLGFIFARAGQPAAVEAALRAAHAQLEIAILPEVRVVQSVHG
jgi:biotin carboxylase